MLKFEPIYHGDKLKIINPNGDVGVVTLWSKIDSAIGVFNKAGIDTSVNSRISVFANLYGNGLPHMLRNLLYNPQIRFIVICGKDLSGSKKWLLNFFGQGLEETEFLGTKSFKIKGTTRIIDNLVTPQDFNYEIVFGDFGDLGDAKTAIDIKAFFDRLKALPEGSFERIDPPTVPEPIVTRFPSEPRSHMILRGTPLEAWKELVFRLYRFGHRNIVAKSKGSEERVELQNTHVIIENPTEESDLELEEFGFSLDKFLKYQRSILNPDKPVDLGYTYGNRLRGYFGGEDGKIIDSLLVCIEKLKNRIESRDAYFSLWDSRKDLTSDKNHPCFVSFYFRKFEEKLTLTATFRVHNAMDAWLENIYGLMAIQRFVAEKVGIEIGPITVISHSISIDPASLDKAKIVAGNKKTDDLFDKNTGKYGPRFDHNGSFTVTIDSSKWELVIEHSLSGVKIGEYRGKNSESIERQLARDCAISNISHALYIGRKLHEKEVEMKLLKSKLS